jgi:hypothetical protein
MNISIHLCHSPIRNMNSGLPEYEAEVLSTLWRRFGHNKIGIKLYLANTYSTHCNSNALNATFQHLNSLVPFQVSLQSDQRLLSEINDYFNDHSHRSVPWPLLIFTRPLTE